MPKRLQLKNRIEVLSEISDIINAMKNLSLMEISKVNKFLTSQDRVAVSLEEIIFDFSSSHPKLTEQFFFQPAKAVIVIGSERGFCGNFNDLVFAKWKNHLSEINLENPLTIFLGHKLCSKLPEDFSAVRKLQGLNSIEEVQNVILKLINELEIIYQETKGDINPSNWRIIYNQETREGLTPVIFNPYENVKNANKYKFSNSPLLYLEPNKFLLELFNQYLFAILYQIFSQSFIVENHQRLKHMEGALDWLEKKQNILTLDFNMRRQEEITEEIEVMMLGAENRHLS